MKIADLVTVSTEPLRDKLESLIYGINTEVIHNAMDLSGWLATPYIGSPDDKKRIFWQGSSTHDEDWEECFDAVKEVMSKRSDVILLLMGFLPSQVEAELEEPEFKGRVEFLSGVNVEEYFNIIKHIRADVGLTPLKDNEFNRAKSCIKWMENSMIGMPTVSSNVVPYSNVIEHEKNGFLCNTKDEWVECMIKCLDNERIRKGIVENARRKISEEFDIDNISKSWERVFRV